MAVLPYVTAPGNIEKALRAIKSAATPERVSQDFVKTILQIPGGSGDQVTSFLKKIGFANSDSSPSDIYKKFRNSASSGTAAAEALKIGYGALYKRNEYMHQLPDEKLKGLIIEETGQGDESSVVSLVFACIKAVKKFADWPQSQDEKHDAPPPAVVKLNDEQVLPPAIGGMGLNLWALLKMSLCSLPNSADRNFQRFSRI